MRISDWSSDVCSSDLGGLQVDLVVVGLQMTSDALGVGGLVVPRLLEADREGLHRPVAQRLHDRDDEARSEAHTSELQSLMRISYAVFCLKKKNASYNTNTIKHEHSYTINALESISNRDINMTIN